MNTVNNAVNYRDLLPRKNGFVFKVVKEEESFIHTFIEGEFLQKLGLCSNDIIGKELKEFLPKEVAAKKADLFEKVWNGAHASYEGKLNGHYYLASLRPKFAGKEVIEIIGTTIDVTEKRKKEINGQMLEKLSLVGQLAAGVAHEIRNPLTSIIGFTQMLQESIGNEDKERYLAIIVSELERINLIVDDFMFLAKPKEYIEITENCINELVHSVIHSMKQELEQKNITIHLTLTLQITAMCDAQQIKQVLFHLIQNAIESSEKGKTIYVTLKKTSENQLLLTIIDKGCGLTEERQDRLFEPYYSTKEKGTGLGLMLTKQIIENHNGKILLNSTAGKGTTVEVYLPLSV
ncbi:ATP-binding protein [Peribacillus sp.]|uniref:ATP-binding protein n=1 Tax=Peribacillus sp. TaxID=2675267 RepID=UPI00388CF2F3